MKKIGILAMVAVLALGALGIGYASWSSTLTITGSVKTGTLEAKFDNVTVAGDGPMTLLNVEPAWAPTVNVDIASDGHSFAVTIEKGYPGFAATVIFDVLDAGTVPGQIDGNGFQIIESPEGTTVTVNDPWGGAYPPWAYFPVSVLSSPYGYTGYPPSVTITINEDADSGIVGEATTIVSFNVVPLY